MSAASKIVFSRTIRTRLAPTSLRATDIAMMMQVSFNNVEMIVPIHHLMYSHDIRMVHCLFEH